MLGCSGAASTPNGTFRFLHQCSSVLLSAVSRATWRQENKQTNKQRSWTTQPHPVAPSWQEHRDCSALSAESVLAFERLCNPNWQFGFAIFHAAARSLVPWRLPQIRPRRQSTPVFQHNVHKDRSAERAPAKKNTTSNNGEATMCHKQGEGRQHARHKGRDEGELPIISNRLETTSHQSLRKKTNKTTPFDCTGGTKKKNGTPQVTRRPAKQRRVLRRLANRTPAPGRRQLGEIGVGLRNNLYNTEPWFPGRHALTPPTPPSPTDKAAVVRVCYLNAAPGERSAETGLEQAKQGSRARGPLNLHLVKH